MIILGMDLCYLKGLKMWKLKNATTRREFCQKMEEKYREGGTSPDDVLGNIHSTVMKAAEEVCGKSKGGRREEKETWWWSDAVQSKLKEKKKAFKTWQRVKDDNSRREYTRARNAAKRTITEAKQEAWREWYEKMETPEGEKTIYKITKQKMKSQKDIGEMVVIKDQIGNILTEADKIRGRWREYFNQLLNIENSRDPLHEVKPVEGPIENIKETEVKKAVERMKKGKATGCSGLSVDLMSSLGEQGLRMMTEMMEAVWREGKIPREWEKSEIVPIYKQKGDPLDCGNYQGIKLLEHMLKVMERVLDQRLRELIEIDNMQFGFRKGRGTTDAIFIVNQLQEKYLEMQRDLFFAFVDLEKAYDRVPREIVYWCLRKRNVPEWLIMLVEATYTNSRTVVRTAQGQTDPFDIKVGLHQGSALSPFLFIVVMDTISKEFRGRPPWELLFADDLDHSRE